MVRGINYEIAQEIASIREQIANFRTDYDGILLHTDIAREEYAALWARLVTLVRESRGDYA